MRALRASLLLLGAALGCSQVLTTSSTGGAVGHGGATTSGVGAGDTGGIAASGGLGAGGTGGIAASGGLGAGNAASSSSGTGGCAPTTCAAQGIECGPAEDGCGCLLDCGTCAPGQLCGGGCVPEPGVCQVPGCCPEKCAQQGIECGIAGDGCGSVLQCGTCPMGQLCSGGHCTACSDTCATSAGCSATNGICMKDSASGCRTCWSWCDGLMCQGFNTCVHDSDCPSPANCVCGPDGCTMCVLGP